MGKLVRAISSNGEVFCCAADTTDLAAEAERIHHTSAVVTAALGRLLTAASMMGSLLKGDQDSLTLRLSGDGPAGTVVAVGDARGNAKGYVQNPIVEIPLNAYGKLDVAGAVGRHGTLTVSKDIGLKEPYIGQTPIISGEIAEDITQYYVVSEQTPTVCALGVLVHPNLTVLAAGGLLAQLLPGASDDTVDRLEENIRKLDAVSSMIRDGFTPESIAQLVLEGLSPQTLDVRQVGYHCGCTRERMERALISLGKQELDKMAAEEPQIEMNCHFCGKKETFTPEQLRQFIQA